MEDPYTELTRAIIKLKEEIVELQDAIHNIYAVMVEMVWLLYWSAVIGVQDAMRDQGGAAAHGGRCTPVSKPHTINAEV